MDLLEETGRDRVLESLMTAGVPEQLAISIIDILVKAGCMHGTAASKLDKKLCVSESLSLPQNKKGLPVFLRFPLIHDTLPALLSTYKQRVDAADGRRFRDMYSYARLAYANADVNTPMLASKDPPCEPK